MEYSTKQLITPLCTIKQIKVPIHCPDTMIMYMFGKCLRDEVAILMVDGHSKKKIRVVQSPAIYLIT